MEQIGIETRLLETIVESMKQYIVMQSAGHLPRKHAAGKGQAHN